VARRSGSWAAPLPGASSNRIAVRMSSTMVSSSETSTAISASEARAASASPSLARSSATPIRVSGVRSSWATLASSSFSWRAARDPVRHLVEAVTQLADLVGAVELASRFEITGPERACRARQPLDRPDDPSRRDQRAEHRMTNPPTSTSSGPSGRAARRGRRARPDPARTVRMERDHQRTTQPRKRRLPRDPPGSGGGAWPRSALAPTAARGRARAVARALAAHADRVAARILRRRAVAGGRGATAGTDRERRIDVARDQLVASSYSDTSMRSARSWSSASLSAAGASTSARAGPRSPA